jgi:CheY-like chemotaxis protein
MTLVSRDRPLSREARGLSHALVRRRVLHENAVAARRGTRVTALGEKIRVAICDDHGPFRRGIAEMLSLADDIEVGGEASTHEEAVALVSELKPDVVILDLEMPGSSMGADESMGRMLALSPPPKVVVLSMHDEPGMVRRFLGRGASAYFPKSTAMAELVGAVRDSARLDNPGSLPKGGAHTAFAPAPRTEHRGGGRHEA